MRAVALLVLLFSMSAGARQFDFKSAGFGTYIRGEYGLAQRGNASFEDSSGTGVSFDQSRSTFAGGEFGLLWASEKSTFRLSAEILMPRHLAITGSSSGGTKYYDLDSKVMGILPQANMDFVVKAFPESRLYVSVGGGVAVVTTTNVYKFTASSPYTGVSDHSEIGKGQSLAFQAGGGYEMMFADHATFAIDLGYRHLRIAELKSSGDVTTITGTYADGATLKNNNGSDRSVDLGGFYAGAGFRFYF